MKVDDDSLRPLPLPTSRETDLETALRQRDAFVFEQTVSLLQLFTSPFPFASWTISILDPSLFPAPSPYSVHTSMNLFCLLASGHLAC